MWTSILFIYIYMLVFFSPVFVVLGNEMREFLNTRKGLNGFFLCVCVSLWT